jgi:DNA-directed RNA polymerase II subunit RPB7
MYLQMKLRQVVTLHPKFFGAKIQLHLEEKLREEVEGKCVAEGYIVSVISISAADMMCGTIDADTGSAHFDIAFDAIMFRMERDEIVDVEVRSVNANGLYCEAGPLRLFVSRHKMEEDVEFDHDMWVSKDGSREIGKGCFLRVKVTGANNDTSHVHFVAATGQMMDNYLGLID